MVGYGTIDRTVPASKPPAGTPPRAGGGGGTAWGGAGVIGGVAAGREVRREIGTDDGGAWRGGAGEIARADGRPGRPGLDGRRAAGGRRPGGGGGRRRGGGAG